LSKSTLNLSRNFECEGRPSILAWNCDIVTLCYFDEMWTYPIELSSIDTSVTPVTLY